MYDHFLFRFFTVSSQNPFWLLDGASSGLNAQQNIKFGRVKCFQVELADFVHCQPAESEASGIVDAMRNPNTPHFKGDEFHSERKDAVKLRCVEFNFFFFKVVATLSQSFSNKILCQRPRFAHLIQVQASWKVNTPKQILNSAAWVFVTLFFEKLLGNSSQCCAKILMCLKLKKHIP